jgi:hypothetical protein
MYSPLALLKQDGLAEDARDFILELQATEQDSLHHCIYAQPRGTFFCHPCTPLRSDG